MTAQQTADVIANAREAVAKGNADYLEATIVALADELEAAKLERDGRREATRNAMRALARLQGRP